VVGRRGRGAAAEHAGNDGGRENVVSLPRRRPRRSQVPTDALTVREMLGQDAMRGARIIAGAGGLDREVRRLNFMSVPNIVRWTKQDEFLLTTGYPLPRQPEEFCQLIEQLAANGLAGLGVKLDEYLAEVPPAAVLLADQAGFPIVVIPATSPLDDVLSQTFETIVNRQAAALARRQQIHDAFLRIALTGGGLARLSDELAEVLPGAAVVICDPAGYPLAATTRPGVRAQDFRDASGRVDSTRLIVGVHKDANTGTHWAVGVIRAGDMRYGFVLAVGGPRGLPGVAGLAVEQAALVAALEIIGVALEILRMYEISGDTLQALL
jgi:PucR family transcriptional regulator, purine catabolism regulatory protein